MDYSSLSETVDELEVSSINADLSINEELFKQVPPPDTPPPSLNFVFHNKVPKSGSSTMKHILKRLQGKNGFLLNHIPVPHIGFGSHTKLVEHVKKKRNQYPDTPLMILKHHTYL